MVFGPRHADQLRSNRHKRNESNFYLQSLRRFGPLTIISPRTLAARRVARPLLDSLNRRLSDPKDCTKGRAADELRALAASFHRQENGFRS